jgi:hypothetical protein
MVNKKAEAAQEKNTVECGGGSSLAEQWEFFYKIIKIRLSSPHNKGKKYLVIAA